MTASCAKCAAASDDAASPTTPLPYHELPLDGLDARCVEALWHCRVDAPLHQRVLPDGRIDLVAHGLHQAQDLRRGFDTVRLAIAGPCDAPGLARVAAGTSSFGVRFRIGWGGLCLDVDPARLRNTVVRGREAEHMLGEDAAALLRARTPEALRAALTGLVARRCAQALPSAGTRRALQAIALLQAGMPRASPSALSARLGVAERTLRRDMLAAAGLPLRTLAGVLRFQHALALAETGTVGADGASSLSERALDSGYADQAHMTREFRRFGGFTPAGPEPAPRVGVGGA